MYRVEPVGDDVQASIDALPAELLTEFAELRVALEVSPTTVGQPYKLSNPGGGLRSVTFGPGGCVTVVFGVIDYLRLVSIVMVIAI